MDLTLILTEDCNLRCTYCYQKEFRATAMPAATGIAAVRKALDEGAESLALTFFGGEPLLQADTLFEILHAARVMEREYGVPVTAKVPTNGLLLTSEIVARAKAYGLFVSLSFDGVRPAQDAGRIDLLGQSSFAAAERALNVLLAAGLPFGVYSVITPANVRYLAASRRFLWDAGVRILISAIDYGGAWDDAAVAALVEQYEELGDLYQKSLAYRGYSHMEPFDSRIALRTRAGDFKNCCPGIRHVTAGPDGTLYGCVEYFYRRLLPLGNVRDWLDAGKVKELAKARAGRMPECGDCGVEDRCTHSCDCVNLRTTGQPNRPPLSVCLTEQATIQSSDSLARRLYEKKSPAFLVRHYSQSYSMLHAMEKLLNDLEESHEPAPAR